MFHSGRFAKTGLVIAGFAAATACFGANTASADIVDDVMPLLTSSCSFDQIDAAMRIVAPDSAARLDNAPFQRAVLQSLFAQPASDRARIFDQIATERHHMSTSTGLGLGAVPLRTQVGPILHKVTESCHELKHGSLSFHGKRKIKNIFKTTPRHAMTRLTESPNAWQDHSR